LAGCGQGRDAADLDEESRAEFRRQALDWLRAELEAQRLLLEQKPETVANHLQDWLWDPDFAGVREPDALAQLSETERQAWHQLWADVADTLARALGRTTPKQKAAAKLPRNC
jgi:serine/threonine-protein kinase